MVKKNLAVFFDGTWNEPNDRTNVYELYKAAPETSTSSSPSSVQEAARPSATASKSRTSAAKPRAVTPHSPSESTAARTLSGVRESTATEAPARAKA